jgi:hypothetical protein
MANPRIGSRAKQTCTVEEEQTVEVVRNHEDGTRGGPAVLLRREARRRAARATDSPTRNDGGAIFGQPQERKSGWTRPDRMDRDVTEESASRSGGSRTHTFV